MANDLIVKDNRLIQAKYNLTKTQIKFIAFMASCIKKDDVDFYTYSIKLNDILKKLDIDRSNWKKLGKTLQSLITKIIFIQNSDNTMEAISFLSYFKITQKNDLVEYRFDKAMKPFLLQLKSNFTKLSLEKIMNFNSQYSIRMYEIIEQKVNISSCYRNKQLMSFEMDLQDIKEILTGEYNIKLGEIIIKKSYHNYGNFKKRVLDFAYKELKEKGDYYFEYEPIKTGRTYTSIKFAIFTNGEKIKKDFVDKQRTMLLSGKEKNLAMEQIRRIIERKGDTIKDKLKYEQKLFQLYLRGELKYDSDLEAIRKELEKKELGKLLEKIN